MHKDRSAVQNILIPLITRKTQEAGSERECTVLNRAFIQGPDPLFLMEVCPSQFSALCHKLDLTGAEGRDAIERAHWQGPGVLLEGSGIPFPQRGWKAMVWPPPLAWRQEALWLCMASVSDTTEEGYKDDVLFATRIQKIAACVNNFSRIPEYFPWVYAQEVLLTFEKETTFTTDFQGIPLTDQDVGFYLAYKMGHKVCAVKHGSKVFYGCVPGVTLDDVGVRVDVKISDSYGYRQC